MTWYAEPGSYTLEVMLNGQTQTTGFKVVRAAGGFRFFGDPDAEPGQKEQVITSDGSLARPGGPFPSRHAHG